MPTTILDGETYEQARHRRFTEEAKVIEKIQQDEIIRMAIDAGLGEYLHLDGWRFTPDGDDVKSLERFFNLAFAAGAAYERNRIADDAKQIIQRAEERGAAHEREACAKLVETTHAEGLQSIREACAEAIRARGSNGS